MPRARVSNLPALGAGETHTFEIRSRNDEGPSPASLPVSVRTIASRKTRQIRLDNEWADILPIALSLALRQLSGRVTRREQDTEAQSLELTALESSLATEIEARAAAIELLSTAVLDNDGRITVNADAITQLMGTIADSATVTALDALTTRVTSNEGGVSANTASITQLMADVLARATVTALDALTTRVTSNEGGVSANTASITQLMADVLDRATVSALSALTTRVTETEGGISVNAESLTTLTAAVIERATVTALTELSARVGENELGLARWLVKLAVDDLVAGVGLYNDGTTTRFTVVADRFAVLPSGATDDTGRQAPFIVDGDVVYINQALIRNATITAAQIEDAFLTNLTAAKGTLAQAFIGQGNIFNLVVGNRFESDNYVQGSAGWRIGRDGSMEIDAGSVRGTFTAEHFEGDIRNVIVALTSGVIISQDGTIATVVLDRSIAGSLYIDMTFTFDADGFKNTKKAYVAASLIPTGTAAARPDNSARAEYPISGSALAQFAVWRNTAADTLYVQELNPSITGNVTLAFIVAVQLPSDSPILATSLDYIYAASAMLPPQPAPGSGLSMENYRPDGSTRTELIQSSLNVYRAFRTRRYANGVFFSATDWGMYSLFSRLRLHVVDRSAKVYFYGPDGTYSPDEDFNLASGNTRPQGITATATRLLVVDSTDNKVYFYGHDGTYYPDEDFNLASGNTSPRGITATATRLLVVDSTDNKVYFYGHDGTYYPDEDFNLASGNTIQRGITATATRLLVVDSTDNKVYFYGHDGTYYPDEDFNLASGNRDQQGITATATRLLVVDFSDNKVYFYGHDGTYYPDEDFNLASGNNLATGITATPPLILSAVTTNVDTIYLAATSQPATPAGGWYEEANLPAGSSRAQPTPSGTEVLYSSTRTRFYNNSVFFYASAWSAYD